jgi:hypothetical protein
MGFKAINVRIQKEGLEKSSPLLIYGGYDYMEFPSPYWSQKTKIELLERWILVHSYLYYDLNKSVASDHVFDKNSSQLVSFIIAFPEAFKESRYYYAMKDFDGSTGFGYVQNLDPSHFEIVSRDAQTLLNLRKELDNK